MRAPLRACACERARVPAGPVDMWDRGDGTRRRLPWSRGDQPTACLTVFIARLHCPARQPPHPRASRRLTRVLERWIHASERGARPCTGRTGCPHATDPAERAPCERVRPSPRRCFYRRPLARRALGLRHIRAEPGVFKKASKRTAHRRHATRRGKTRTAPCAPSHPAKALPRRIPLSPRAAIGAPLALQPPLPHHSKLEKPRPRSAGAKSGHGPAWRGERDAAAGWRWWRRSL